MLTLGIATEALAEQSDSTGVTLVEDTLGAPREGNKWLDQMQSYYFFILRDEDNNIDNFVLNKHININRSSLFIIQLTIKLVVHILFKEILGNNIEFKY